MKQFDNYTNTCLQTMPRLLKRILNSSMLRDKGLCSLFRVICVISFNGLLTGYIKN